MEEMAFQQGGVRGENPSSASIGQLPTLGKSLKPSDQSLFCLYLVYICVYSVYIKLVQNK